MLRRASREWWRDLYVEIMMIREYPPWDLERHRDDDDAEGLSA